MATKFVVGARSEGIYQALHAAGVFTDDPNDVRRVVIDLQVGEPARIYVDKFADTTLTDVILAGGIEIMERSAA